MLPNIKKILENGFSSNLKVTIPPVTIPSWPCLFSGLTPEQMGYYWFDHPKNGLFNSFHWRDKSILSLKDLRVFALNIPGTYPAWKINGEMITGMMSPKISCYPKEIEFGLDKEWIISGKTIRDIFKEFEIKKRLFLKKLNEDFNLLAFVVRIPDSISHHTHLDTKIISNYLELGYKKIDDFLGDLLNHDNFDNIIIFSDHGLKLYNYEFNISRWLEKEGLLFINNLKGQKSYSMLGKLYDPFRSFLKIDYRKYLKIKRTKLKNILDDTVSTQIKKENTRALAFSSNVGGLFLDKSRKFKKRTIKDLLEKDNRVKEVISSEIDGFPDLFIILKDKYIFNHHSSYFITRRRNLVNHSQIGFFLAYGKNIRHGKSNHVSFKDVSPTILKLFGLEKQNYMKGESLNIFKNLK